jgi:magnesium chelatase subunit H
VILQRDLANCPREAGEIRLVEERLTTLTKRITKWTNLRKKAPKDRRVAVVLYGYPPGIGATGTAALLNVPQSLHQLLSRMRDEGYDVGQLPDPEEIVELVRVADTDSDSGRGYKNAAYGQNGGGSVSVGKLADWLGKGDAARVSKNWGGGLDKSGIRTVGSGDAAEMLLGGRRFGNVWVGVQPPLGVPGDPMRLLFQRDMTPHPQYTAFYKYMERDESEGGLAADAVLHFGMHGTEEWLPGTPLGNTGECWPDILTGGLPNIYVYAANNPSESLLAKRRGYGTLISHNVPPYSRAGLYKELVTLRGLMSDYQETEMRVRNEGLAGKGESGEAAMGFASGGGGAGGLGGGVGGVGGGQVVQAVDSSKVEGAPTTEGALLQTVLSAGLDKDCPLPEGAMAAIEAAGGLAEGEKAVEAGAAYMAKEGLFEVYCENLKIYLAELEQRLFSSGLHVLGRAPSVENMRAYLTAYFEDGSWQQGDKSSTDSSTKVVSGGASEQVDAAQMPFPESIMAMILEGRAEADVLMFRDDPAIPKQATEAYGVYQSAVREAINIRSLLMRNTEELDGVLRALNGEFVPPAPGGDLLRDGSGVLPTGRNIHALDPYRLPSKVAMSRGRAAAELTLEMHKRDNNGELPETVAVNLWGLEAIKTRGESVAIVLALIGAEPVMEATGRVVKYELIPLDKLGRPRVDVLASLSGIFRDSFANVVELLDDLFVRAAQADEAPEMNYIRKHFLQLQAEGESVEASTARIFSNPPGEFGSMVNERVSDGSWESEGELGETWASRNSYSFGRNGRGVERRKTLNALMKTTTQVVQCIDSVEYGLTDIQEYYANTGAMVRAMDDIQGGAGKVQATVVEGFAREARPKKLNDVLRLEYRSKLLNPKWADEMVAQGSGGAFEVSQRMTAMIGWGATTKFKEKWVFDQSAATYALDPDMAKKLMDANPEAFKNIVGRLLEATNRGMWEPSADVLAQLQDLYQDVDDAIELGTATIRRDALKDRK